MPSTSEKKRSTSPSQRDRRRSQRLALTFPIEIVGLERCGRMFRDRTTTSDVNEHGCRFDLLRELYRGEVVAIQRLGRDGRPMRGSTALLFQVVWTEANERGWSIGVNKLQPRNIWRISFPPHRPL